MALSITATERDALLDSYGANFNSGTLVIYSGSVPASADASLGSPTVLATCTFGVSAFNTAAAGSMTAKAITSGTAINTATANFYRAFKSDATTVLEQGLCGVGTGELQLNTTAIVTGGPVEITSFVRSM